MWPSMTAPCRTMQPSRCTLQKGVEACRGRPVNWLLLCLLVTAAAAPTEQPRGQPYSLDSTWEREGTSSARRRGLQQAVGPLTESSALRIPKILHHVFIRDPKDTASANLTMWPQHERWVEACRYHYSPSAGWKYMYWNAADSEELIAQHYPFFLDFYRANITLANEKSDVVRYVLMHQFGGLYLDSDTECWREGADMLQGFDIVLQGTHPGEGVGSGSIASVPGVPLWRKTLDMMMDRNTNTTEWWRSLERTGPNLLADTLEAVGVKADPEKMFREEYQVEGLVYRVYPAGEWFLPCQWFDLECRRRVYEERASGQTDLRRTVGMHRFAGSWIEKKKDGKGIRNVKKEMCKEYRIEAALLLVALLAALGVPAASKLWSRGCLARLRVRVLKRL